MSAAADAHVRLRVFEENDLAAAHALSVAVGWPHRLRDWRAVFRLGNGFVACDAMERVVGTAMLWPFSASFGTVGMIIVAPGMQGQGTGRRLMQALLEGAACRTLQLNATAAGKPLYELAGFRAIGTIHQHQGIVRHPGGSATMAGVRPATQSDWQQIIALDRAAGGTDRGPALRALVDTAAGTVRMQDGSITGFAFSRPFGCGRVIGPVVASDETTAAALVQPHIERNAGRFLRIDTPHGGSAFCSFLEQSGLILVDRAVTMIRGSEPARSDSLRIFALINQALG